MRHKIAQGKLKDCKVNIYRSPTIYITSVQQAKLQTTDVMFDGTERCMIINTEPSGLRHTVGFRRTGDRTAEQAIFRASRTSRRADQTDVDDGYGHGAISRIRKRYPIRVFDSMAHGDFTAALSALALVTSH